MNIALFTQSGNPDCDQAEWDLRVFCRLHHHKLVIWTNHEHSGVTGSSHFKTPFIMVEDNIYHGLNGIRLFINKQSP